MGKFTTILLCALIGACDPGPGGNPPPVSQGRPQPDPVTCDALQSCAIECASLNLGPYTTDARIDCVEACPYPQTSLGEDLVLDWAYSCAHIGRVTNDICTAGLPVCAHLEKLAE